MSTSCFLVEQKAEGDPRHGREFGGVGLAGVEECGDHSATSACALRSALANVSPRCILIE
jgi:hypothetical protein